jgi:eukaryotic-like serine/threonine-protein kinase
MNGKTLGHYRVGEQLGRGGMGEVYLADDLNLNRKVALKFLPDAFAGDPERMARFEREAKVLASLNHPNIAAIYGLEQAEGKRFLVLELVEGETLAQRLSKGPLPVDEALVICRQIAEGLEAAHDKGVMHRDLKPANVMITEGDKVKILDFGLAKALSDETQSIDSSQSPTLTEAMTRPGIILGTAAYMSPEQAKGKIVDKRADIWAFGCILYECLTGKRAFEGETVTETLAALLKSEPDWPALPAAIPQNIRLVLHRCLEKDMRRRFQNATDVRIVIEEPQEIGERPAAVNVSRPWLAWTIAALAVLIALALGFLLIREIPQQTEEPVRFQIEFPAKLVPAPSGALALSPDGRHLVFAAISDGVMRLWLRSFDYLEARPLPGTESGWFAPLFWSPDSRFIAFGTEEKLKKIDLSGSPPQTICDVAGLAIGGSWNRDGVIIYADYNGSRGIMRVSAAGGSPVPLTTPDPEWRETSHVLPTFFPDGRHFLYFRNGLPEHAGIYIGSLDAKPEDQGRKRLLAAASAAIYVSPQDPGPGHLLFIREQTLLSHPFDEKRLELIGEPKAVAEGVGAYGPFGFFSASTTGDLIWRSADSGSSQFAWLDRSGRELGTIGEPGEYPTFDLSRDGSRLVFSRGSVGDRKTNLWVMDLLRASITRLTLDDASHTDPRWSPDGRQVIFDSTRDPWRSPFRVSLPDSKPEQVYKFEGQQFALDDWSPDGGHLLYHDTQKSELWALPLTGEHKPVLVTRSLAGFVDQAQFSPDGRWIAYNTDESGRHEVKVVPFPPASEKWPISTAGGVQPTWSADGRELYFLAPDGTLMAVEIKPGAKFEWGKPRPLFKVTLSVHDQMEQYAPHPDGKRFLFAKPSEQSSNSPFTVILNWTSLLKK